MRSKFLLGILVLGLGFGITACRDYESIQRALDAHTIPGATYVGSETCATCHEKEVKEFKLSSHERISIPLEGTNVEGCEMCHGPGSKHAENGGGKGVFIINPNKDPSACFVCHMEKKKEFNLPFHHPVLEGKMSCTDCHDPHGSDIRSSATSMDGPNDVCFKCHKDQQGPFVFEHEAIREGCVTCHQIHGSISDKMLVNRDNNLCLRCHTQSDFPNMDDTGHGPTTNRLNAATCFSGGCHTGVHGSNFDEHLRS